MVTIFGKFFRCLNTNYTNVSYYNLSPTSTKTTTKRINDKVIRFGKKTKKKNKKIKILRNKNSQMTLHFCYNNIFRNKKLIIIFFGEKFITHDMIWMGKYIGWMIWSSLTTMMVVREKGNIFVWRTLSSHVSIKHIHTHYFQCDFFPLYYLLIDFECRIFFLLFFFKTIFKYGHSKTTHPNDDDDPKQIWWWWWWL